MRQLLAVLFSFLLTGCFGAQVRQEASPAPISAPSPEATPASMAGTANLLLLGTYAQWEAAQMAIKATGKDPLAHNGKVILLPVRFWNGKGWNKVGRAAFFHWAPGARLSAEQEAAVAVADVVVACYATTLPPHARAKAWIVSLGKTQAWSVTTGRGYVLIHGQDEGVKRAPSAQDDDSLAKAAAEGMSK